MWRKGWSLFRRNSCRTRFEKRGLWRAKFRYDGARADSHGLHHSDGIFAAVAFDRRAVLKALIASFSVYLLPVFTVHVFYLWGWAIGAEILAGKSGREPLWLATDAALALGLQGLAFALFYWILSGRGWRWLALVAAVPVFEAVLIWAYLLAIPAVFLIEDETATETGDWPIACRIEDATLLQVRAPAVPDLARAQEAWIGSATM